MIDSWGRFRWGGFRTRPNGNLFFNYPDNSMKMVRHNHKGIEQYITIMVRKVEPGYFKNFPKIAQLNLFVYYFPKNIFWTLRADCKKIISGTRIIKAFQTDRMAMMNLRIEFSQ